MTPSPVADRFTVELARQMRIALDDSGMTRAALAQKSSVPYRTLKRYLDAEREVRTGELGAIASALGVSITSLVDAAEDRLD